MSEKRFRKGNSILTDFPTGAIIDEENGERYYDGIKPSYISSKELVKILNELHEENQQLRQILNIGETNAKDIVDVLNIQQREIKELKQELKIYRKIASCSNCEYQNYDWFDDGDEFEICERGNNEQQIEYHICKDWREL